MVNRKKFEVNNYLCVELRGKKVVLLVSGFPFEHHKRILVNITPEYDRNIQKVDSIDEIVNRYAYYPFENDSTSEEIQKHTKQLQVEYQMEPEMEFWAHSSNLQVWYEHKYDVRLLHSRLAFPLLRELAKEGDSLAIKSYKKEIVKALLRNYPPTVSFIIWRDYLWDLSVEEILSAIKAFKKLHLKDPYVLLTQDIIDRWSEYALRKVKKGKDRTAELKRIASFIATFFNEMQIFGHCKHVRYPLLSELAPVVDESVKKAFKVELEKAVRSNDYFTFEILLENGHLWLLSDSELLSFLESYNYVISQKQYFYFLATLIDDWYFYALITIRRTKKQIEELKKVFNFTSLLLRDPLLSKSYDAFMVFGNIVNSDSDADNYSEEFEDEESSVVHRALTKLFKDFNRICEEISILTEQNG